MFVFKVFLNSVSASCNDRGFYGFTVSKVIVFASCVISLLLLSSVVKPPDWYCSQGNPECEDHKLVHVNMYISYFKILSDLNTIWLPRSNSHVIVSVLCVVVKEQLFSAMSTSGSISDESKCRIHGERNDEAQPASLEEIAKRCLSLFSSHLPSFALAGFQLHIVIFILVSALQPNSSHKFLLQRPKSYIQISSNFQRPNDGFDADASLMRSFPMYWMSED